MKEVTMEDINQLVKDFEEYTKTAEVHEYPILALFDFNFQRTLKQLNSDMKDEVLSDQRNMRAMMRCGRISARVCHHHGRSWTFGCLRYHEVEVYPCQELLVLSADIELESGIKLVELFVVVLGN